MDRRTVRRSLVISIVIGVGGFGGAIARYGTELLVGGTLLSTFLVNVIGSFLLGLVVYDALEAPGVDSRTRLLFGTGFLSSFTTYSTFIADVIAVPEFAIAYVGASYAIGFGAVVLARILIDPGSVVLREADP